MTQTTTPAIPMIGFCAYSGTGKTTLLKKLIPLLKQRDLRIAVIKHSHHDFEIDHPGKDSYELRKAGADQMLIASRHRIVNILEMEGLDDAPPLRELASRLDSDSLDLILVEGYRHEQFPKIELHRPSLGKQLIFPQDPSVVAIAVDEPLREKITTIPVLNLNDPEEISDFVVENLLP